MTRSRGRGEASSGASRYARGRYAEPDRYTEPDRYAGSDRYGASERYADDYDSPGSRRSPGGGGGGSMPGGRGPGGGSGGKGPSIALNMGSIAILAGVLVVGIGIGSAVTSTTQGNQGNIASSQQLDMAVPDPEFCRQWGASAFVMDIELYTTMNPSSSFVT
ncbi:MAG: DUF3172 domain-containing protein, partial [Synechococcus sp.]